MYQNPFTERFLVIAEKPSVARTIAQILVCEDKKDGYLEGPESGGCFRLPGTGGLAGRNEYFESLYQGI